MTELLLHKNPSGTENIKADTLHVINVVFVSRNVTGCSIFQQYFTAVNSSKSDKDMHQVVNCA